ncbi:MAG: phosphomannomutase/phosphoglucomutase [Beutenbergiaceae bacterium]
MPTSLQSIVKANDIRGAVPQMWDAQTARALGAAFADVIARPDGAPQIAIGQDMRTSSPELARAFGEGAAARGIDVVHIGQCSTDGLYHASGMLDLPAAMFTASHNPAGDNGIKLCRSSARPVGRESGLPQVAARAQQYLDDAIPIGAPGAISTRETLADYASYLRDLVDLRGQRALKVVIDAGNGMAGLTVPAVLGEAAGLPDLGLHLVPLYFDLDGSFPHHEPNPLVPENLRDLQAAVVAEQADIGLAFDGDADRCFVVDELGSPVSPSAVAVLVGLAQVERERAARRNPTVVHNLITSRAVPDLLTAAGATTIATPVGHAVIKTAMATHDAVFGAEHSAHYYFRDFWFADTGMLAAMLVLQALRSSSVTMSDLVQMYSPYQASGEINSAVPDQQAALARVRGAYAGDIASGTVRLDERDGLTVDHWHAYPRWWLNVRGSNTEPLLRLNVEAEDEDIMVKVRDAVLALLRD